ncbi:uncharacterized protein LOC126675234 [Mercurialis annua]|uniref:uncharacterized protein LOC126675234 n=1 Tax=Mercurialis annua TaxID=3986 RepID=UPI00215EE544|nr:uncharacterized protein LOC126675234 [Mercurialis annua]
MANVETPKYYGIIRIIVMLLCLFSMLDDSVANWLNHGADMSNTRNAKGEVLINRFSVQNLRLKWSFFAGKDISATPAIADHTIYFPSWNGYVYAVNAFNGALIWKQNISQLTGLSGTGFVSGVNVTVSRSTPTVAGDLLIITIYGPAYVLAVKRSSGRFVWLTRLDPRPRALITQSGTFYIGAFYVGVSSLEEALPANECCIFRGSVAKLDIRTGAVKWQTYMLPDNGGNLGGYAGAAVWGSSPAIDWKRKLVYVGTGNLYAVPLEVSQCQEAQNNLTTKPSQPCFGPDAHFNSILAIKLDSGEIAWATQLGGYDAFTFNCLVPNSPTCPVGPNKDADFGEAPMLISIVANGKKRDVAVAVPKSGFAWALDRDTGDLVWFKLAGPGSLEGGGLWGAATDSRTVYTNIVNGFRETFILAPSNQTTTAGAWVALEANSGQILWSTENPSNETAHGPVTVVNDLLFAGSVAPNGPLYAMETRTGKIIWSYNSGATIYGGVSAAYGCIYFGNGFTVGLAKRFHPTWTAGTSLYALCL